MNIFIPFYALSTLPTQAIYVSIPEISVHHKTQHYYFSRHYIQSIFRRIPNCRFLPTKVIILLKSKLHRFVNHIEKYIKLKIILTIRIEQQTRVVREKNMAKIINLWIFAKSKISHCRHVLYSFLYCSEITSNILIFTICCHAWRIHVQFTHDGGVVTKKQCTFYIDTARRFFAIQYIYILRCQFCHSHSMPIIRTAPADIFYII